MNETGKGRHFNKRHKPILVDRRWFFVRRPFASCGDTSGAPNNARVRYQCIKEGERGSEKNKILEEFY